MYGGLIPGFTPPCTLQDAQSEKAELLKFGTSPPILCLGTWNSFNELKVITLIGIALYNAREASVRHAEIATMMMLYADTNQNTFINNAPPMQKFSVKFQDNFQEVNMPMSSLPRRNLT